MARPLTCSRPCLSHTRMKIVWRLYRWAGPGRAAAKISPKNTRRGKKHTRSLYLVHRRCQVRYSFTGVFSYAIIGPQNEEFIAIQETDYSANLISEGNTIIPLIIQFIFI